jgi:glycosyltransferase involved in cell wall biosynthesis
MVATYHGDDILGYCGVAGAVPFKSKVRSLTVRLHSQLFAATITQSMEMHRRLPRRSQRRDRVIRCGVDLEHFPLGDRIRARRALGWPESERVVLFAARRPSYPLKRLDLAKAVVDRAQEELGPIRLVIAENLPPEQVAMMMNAADCLLMTSAIEGSPMVVKEAMVCNLPVVATDVGDVREILTGVVPSKVCRCDVCELTEALVYVLRTRRRSNGRDKSGELDQSVAVRGLMNLYAELGAVTYPAAA